MSSVRRGPGPRPPHRGLRTVVPAAVATLLGAAGHLLAGGSVGLLPIGSALLLVALPAWLLTGRERSWLTIAGAQVALQQVVHAVLAAGAHPPDMVGLLPHDLMLYTHVLAALLSAAVLRLGERRVWAVARRLSARLAAWWRGIAAGVAPVAGPVPLPAWRPSRACPLRLLLRHSRVLRGPPARPA